MPYIRSPRKYFDTILPRLGISSETVIYDLGSGRGDFLFAAEKYGPKKLIGYELAGWPLFWSRCLARIKKSKAIFLKKDFFAADISDADIIYLFLVPKVVNQLWPYIKKHAKQGCKVVVLSDKIDDIEPVQRIATRPGQKNTTYYSIYVI